jgi:uncharacterized membrane protein
MLLTGFSHLVLVRALYDRIAAGEVQVVRPLYQMAILVNGGVHLLVAAGFWAPQALPLSQKIWFIALFGALGLNGQATIFMGSLSRHTFVILALLGGNLLGVGLAALLAASGSLAGLVAGFATGMLVTFALLSGKILADFGDRQEDFRAWTRIKVYPALLGIGLFYNLGLCSDRMVFWLFYPEVERVGPFVSYPSYELAVLLAYLSVLPGQALIVLRLETDFFRRCLEFSAAVMGRAGLSTLEALRKEIEASLSLSLERVVAVQGSFTLVSMLLGPQLLSWLHLPPDCLPLYRAVLVGSFFGLLFQGALLVLIYLVQYRMALAAAALFLVLQAALTGLTLGLGPATFGYGYLGASLLSLAVSVPFLARSLKGLEYRAFALQPVPHD